MSDSVVASLLVVSLITVNSKIFMRVLFSSNFADAKFRENKTSRNGEITLSFNDVGKSCHSYEFLTPQICLLTLSAKIKFSRISYFTVCMGFRFGSCYEM